MRSRDDAVPRGAGPERALTLGLCGIGGRLHPAPDSLQDALTLADAQAMASAADAAAAPPLSTPAAAPAVGSRPRRTAAARGGNPSVTSPTAATARTAVSRASSRR